MENHMKPKFPTAVLLSFAILFAPVFALATDLTVTAASVVSATSPVPLFADGTAGATITAGQPVYLDSGTTTYKLADNNLSAAASTVAGIAVNGASSGQPIRIQTQGDINIGATLTVGKCYVLSATAGGVCPIADVDATSGNRITILGVASTASNLKLKIFSSLAAVP